MSFCENHDVLYDDECVYCETNKPIPFTVWLKENASFQGKNYCEGCEEEKFTYIVCTGKDGIEICYHCLKDVFKETVNKEKKLEGD